MGSLTHKVEPLRVTSPAGFLDLPEGAYCCRFDANQADKSWPELRNKVYAYIIAERLPYKNIANLATAHAHIRVELFTAYFSTGAIELDMYELKAFFDAFAPPELFSDMRQLLRKLKVDLRIEVPAPGQTCTPIDMFQLASVARRCRKLEFDWTMASLSPDHIAQRDIGTASALLRAMRSHDAWDRVQPFVARMELDYDTNWATMQDFQEYGFRFLTVNIFPTQEAIATRRDNGMTRSTNLRKLMKELGLWDILPRPHRRFGCFQVGIFWGDRATRALFERSCSFD
jgi:hypothetical protein